LGQLSPAPKALPRCASQRSCTQLHASFGGWTGDTSFNTIGASVCGESDNGLGGCGADQCFGGAAAAAARTAGWAQAEQICTAAGGRLCTVAELQAEVRGRPRGGGPFAQLSR
jgi:hypothetical protein